MNPEALKVSRNAKTKTERDKGRVALESHLNELAMLADRIATLKANAAKRERVKACRDNPSAKGC